eukprot:g11008.t1
MVHRRGRRPRSGTPAHPPRGCSPLGRLLRSSILHSARTQTSSSQWYRRFSDKRPVTGWSGRRSFDRQGLPVQHQRRHRRINKAAPLLWVVAPELLRFQPQAIRCTTGTTHE